MAQTNPEEFLGQGITLPFRIDSMGDVAHAEGEDNLRSCVRLLIATQVGELRWDPGFGLDLLPLVHAGEGLRLESEAQRRIIEGFTDEPRVEIQDVLVNFRRDVGALDIHMRYRTPGRLEPPGGVIITESVTIPTS